MRTRTFEVPTEIVAEIARQLEESQLTGEITGVTEDDEILLAVSYDTDQREDILTIMEIIEDYFEEEE